MDLDSLRNDIPLAWDDYFKGFSPVDITYVILDNPAFFKKLSEMFNDTTIPLNDWKMFLKCKLIQVTANYLHDEVFEVQFNFFSRELMGMRKRKPRW